ncbi:hypothetical protein EDB81DRAFT_753954 [Dactylonectria macrodidyma]|uniref:Uncharacterized protein n=1 Tax=Dactylonectria macrodidyma TaxID=307937 RepID=A0A9P9FKQ1_9HYPO|nr:hypothetical protein EDB81DRAFT_753954 [Dactylonectria macrodidyma]
MSSAAVMWAAQLVSSSAVSCDETVTAYFNSDNRSLKDSFAVEPVQNFLEKRKIKDDVVEGEMMTNGETMAKKPKIHSEVVSIPDDIVRPDELFDNADERLVVPKI